MFEDKKIHPKDGTISKETTFANPPVLQLSWRDLDKELYNQLVQCMLNWTEQQGFFSFLSTNQEAACLGWEFEIDDAQTEITDWNELSRMGLLYALNTVVLHPAGFAITRDPSTGHSNILIYDNVDGKFDFTEEDHAEGREKLANFGFQIPQLFINDRV